MTEGGLKPPCWFDYQSASSSSSCLSHLIRSLLLEMILLATTMNGCMLSVPKSRKASKASKNSSRNCSSSRSTKGRCSLESLRARSLKSWSMLYTAVVDITVVQRNKQHPRPGCSWPKRSRLKYKIDSLNKQNIKTQQD